MAISVIRSLSEEDKRRLQRAGTRFCSRHGIPLLETGQGVFDGLYFTLIEFYIEFEAHIEDRRRLRALWTRVKCRAVRVAYDRRVHVTHTHIGLSL